MKIYCTDGIGRKHSRGLFARELLGVMCALLMCDSAFGQSLFSYRKDTSRVQASAEVEVETPLGVFTDDGGGLKDKLLFVATDAQQASNDSTTSTLASAVSSAIASSIQPIGETWNVPSNHVSTAANGTANASQVFAAPAAPIGGGPSNDARALSSFTASSRSTFTTIAPAPGSNAVEYMAIYVASNEGYSRSGTGELTIGGSEAGGDAPLRLFAEVDNWNVVATGSEEEGWTVGGTANQIGFTVAELNYLTISPRVAAGPLEITALAGQFPDFSTVEARATGDENSGGNAGYITGLAAAAWVFSLDFNDPNLGDFDNDGVVNQADIARVPRDLNNNQIDQNGDGVIDADDARFLDARFDLNNDGVLDAKDIDYLGDNALGSVFNDPEADGVSDLRFDLNGDGIVNFQPSAPGIVDSDSDLLIKVGLNTVYGDLNFDEIVDGVDLGMRSPNFGKIGNATYAEGDLNNDGTIDGIDLGIFSANFGYGVPPTAPTAAAVPEPGSLTILASIVIAMGFIRRRTTVTTNSNE